MLTLQGRTEIQDPEEERESLASGTGQAHWKRRPPSRRESVAKRKGRSTLKVFPRDEERERLKTRAQDARAQAGSGGRQVVDAKGVVRAFGFSTWAPAVTRELPGGLTACTAPHASRT